MAYTDIDKSDEYFNTVLWTGDATTKDITGVGFQPDLVWAKKRSATGYHAWCDAVRGGTKNIFSNDSIAEETSATDWILSFASDGFGVNSAGNLNQSSATYVAWNFLASNTTASNTDGSITSTVSANTTSGFSIVSYTGTGSNATVGHGLGVTPKMIIAKQRTGTENWPIYHVGLSSPNNYLELNSTGAVLTNSAVWNSTNPTSSVFSVGTNARTNNNTSTYIAYCFAEKKGFSKFGIYTGNGNADGTFIYTGFKPAFVIIKRTTGAEGWNIGDNKRNITYPSGANVNNAELQANLSNAETDRSTRGGGTTQYDMLSNGFKLRGNNPEINKSPEPYIYMAFAENPFVTSTGIPTTAR
jgi:hypothetical protein